MERLKHATIPYGSKYQIILPNNHLISKLIVRNKHNRGNMGTEYVFSILKKKWWIVKVRSLIKRTASRCSFCKRRNAKNVEPLMSGLPSVRTEAMKSPFTNTGVDLFEPMLVKHTRIKQWGALFICFTTRAVHIEEVKGLDTDIFINA